MKDRKEMLRRVIRELDIELKKSSKKLEAIEKEKSDIDIKFEYAQRTDRKIDIRKFRIEQLRLTQEVKHLQQHVVETEGRLIDARHELDGLENPREMEEKNTPDDETE